MPAIERLRPHEQHVYEIIQAAGGEWVTRGQIAALLERPGRIQPNDIAALDKLVLLDFVEVREGKRGASATRWEYRAKVDEQSK